MRTLSRSRHQNRFGRAPDDIHRTARQTAPLVSIDADARKVQIRVVFDRLAPEYDAAGPACFAYFGRRLVEEAAVGYGQRVLDVACGRGAVLFSAAEPVGAAGEVIGIDLAAEMVRATNVEARRRGVAVSAALEKAVATLESR